MTTLERAAVILENETMRDSHTDIQSRYISYLHMLDEKREEILLDFIVEYMILINNEQKSASTLNIDGRLINKIYLLFCYNQGITIPFDLGADPAYDPLLFSKLENFRFACGFHPGLEFTRSILVDKKKLKELKENLRQTEREVDTILKLHFGWNLGVRGLMEHIHRIVSSLEKKTEKDQLAKDVDQKLIGDLLDSMKLDYISHEIKEKKRKIDPNTKNIIEEIDSIFLNEMKPNYVDEVELERKIKHAFKNHNRSKSSKRMLRIGKSHHGYSCEMNEGEYDYLLNLEYLEAVKELNGIAKIVTCDQKNYLVFRGTSLRSFLGNRWDPNEEYRCSHIHYYFMEIKRENLNDIEGITKKLERSLHGVVAKRFPVEDCIRDQLEVEEETVLKERYVRHYELLKEVRSQLEDMNIESPQIDTMPKYGGLILATLSISCKPNIPLTKEDIQSYLEKIEIETLLNLGDFEIRRTLYCFKNGGFSFEDLYKILSQQYSEGKHLKERLRLLSSKLTELLPTGYMSENTRPLQLKTILNEKKCICEGYVIIFGLLFHFWQDIFPELLNTDVYFCLFQNETLNNVVKGAKFREPHMFVVVRIDNKLEVVDPTNRISDETIRTNKGLEELLQGEGYKKIYKIRKTEEICHD